MSPSFFKGSDRPVDSVSWQDAVLYANRRSALEKRTPCYHPATWERVPMCSGYRLPTAAEWSLMAGSKPPEGAWLRGADHRDEKALRAAGGTHPVASGTADAKGFYHLYGNVWEWCEDWFNAEPYVDAVRNPRGPGHGIERVIRGGSILTTPTAWNKGFVSSMPPGRRSRFTGFRVVRSEPPVPSTSPAERRPSASSAIAQRWTAVLGELPRPATPPASKVLSQPGEFTWRGTLADLYVEPNHPARILFVEPVHRPQGRLPVVIVPFYDVDSPAGTNLGGRRAAAGGTRAFAQLAAQHGFIAVAIRWFAEGDAENYDEAIWELAQRHPQLTPMGKWIYDVRRLVDYLVTRPDVDIHRIAIFGHSLGGKMSLYAGAFEPRIAAVMSSEPGLSLAFSNYSDFWYLGTKRALLPAGADHDDLLRLIAPRPFLLIAGESADGEKSRTILDRSPGPVTMINHGKGHSPTEDSLHQAMEWLHNVFDQR
jgi:predicted dienelactone hydrolase